MYDDFGNLAARTDNKRNLEETFTYDHLNRLTDIWLNDVHTGHMTYDALGRMTDKRTDGQNVFSAAQHDYVGPDGQLRPHAISSATVEGNPFPTEQQDITYTMFDKVGTITQPYNNGLYTLSYAYGYNHQRRRIVENYGNAVFRKKIYGDHCEFVTENSYNSSSTFLTGPLGVFAVVEKKVNGVESVHYVLKDHLGSWTTITDANGNIVREQSFDAWGNMRDPDTWTGTVTQQPMFDRGFTGHEHLNSFGLINMNGRMYDPVMSSFLSVDNYVQAPDYTQSFNRYAYCLNNPLKYTDPSGEIPVLAVVAIGAAVTVIMNGINNVRHGENFFHGAGPAAVTGGVQALFAHAIGESANVIGSVIKNQATAHLAKTGFQLVAHGTMSGMSMMWRGGNFWQGFVSTATASVISSAINQACIHFQLSERFTITAMIAGGAISGGISAEIAGGDFIDGFCNGLICVGLNHALHLVVGGGWIMLKGLEKLSLTTQSDSWKPSPTMCKYEVLAKIEEAFLGEFARTASELQQIARENGWENSSVFSLYSKLNAEYYVYDAEFQELVDAMISGDPVVLSSVKLNANGYAVANSGHARIIVGVLPCDDTQLQLIDPLSSEYKFTMTSSLNRETRINNVYYEMIRFSKQQQLIIW